MKDYTDYERPRPLNLYMTTMEGNFCGGMVLIAARTVKQADRVFRASESFGFGEKWSLPKKVGTSLVRRPKVIQRAAWDANL